MTTDFSVITKWYSGKALKIVTEYVLPTLAVAEEQGYWPKGAGRKVWAALNKQSVAIKFANANDRNRNIRQSDSDDSKLEGLLDDVRDDRKHYFQAKISGSHLVHCMMFGQVGNAPGCVQLAVNLREHARNEAEHVALSTAMQWALDCAPVGKLLATLDSRRIPPTIVLKTLSPTVATNLGKALAIDFTTIASPPMKSEWVTRTVKGKEVQVLLVTILWPAGTLHGRSRYAAGSAHNDLCHACGHAIKDPWNWVPLMAQGAAAPLSLWVGRDCARKLFGCDVSGDAEYTNRTEAASGKAKS